MPIAELVLHNAVMILDCPLPRRPATWALEYLIELFHTTNILPIDTAIRSNRLFKCLSRQFIRGLAQRLRIARPAFLCCRFRLSFAGGTAKGDIQNIFRRRRESS
jgi:hypothetical protein